MVFEHHDRKAYEFLRFSLTWGGAGFHPRLGEDSECTICLQGLRRQGLGHGQGGLHTHIHFAQGDRLRGHLVPTDAHFFPPWSDPYQK